MKQLFPIIAALLLTASCANIHEAARHGEIEAVTAMVDDGDAVDRRNDEGMTPLMIAVRADRMDIVDLLLERGADVSVRDDKGYTALWHAFQTENAAAFQKILERDAPTDRFLAAHDPGALPPARRRLFRLAAEYDLVKGIQRRSGGADLRYYDTYFSKFPKGHYVDKVSAMLHETIEADYREVKDEGSVAALQRFIAKYDQLGQRSFLVTASILNIRAANSTRSSKVGEYEKGDVLYAVTIQDNWVQTDRGWVSKTYLKQIRRRIPVTTPYLDQAVDKIERVEKSRARTYRPPVRRVTPKVTRKKTPSPAQPAKAIEPEQPVETEPVKPEPVPTLTQPDQPVDARKELEAILDRPTLEALEAFILKYKDQPAQEPLVIRARQEYRSILLGE
jgi:hypothetical protein